MPLDFKNSRDCAKIVKTIDPDGTLVKAPIKGLKEDKSLVLKAHNKISTATIAFVLERNSVLIWYLKKLNILK